jgi:hypothetical protein
MFFKLPVIWLKVLMQLNDNRSKTSFKFYCFKPFFNLNILDAKNKNVFALSNKKNK